METKTLLKAQEGLKLVHSTKHRASKTHYGGFHQQATATLTETQPTRQHRPTPPTSFLQKRLQNQLPATTYDTRNQQHRITANTLQDIKNFKLIGTHKRVQAFPKLVNKFPQTAVAGANAP